MSRPPVGDAKNSSIERTTVRSGPVSQQNLMARLLCSFSTPKINEYKLPKSGELIYIFV